MEQQTKKNLIFGGSIAAAALIGLSLGLGIGFGTSGSNSTNQSTQIAANEKGIGAFSNLDSFDNDGFNYGVREAAIQYTQSQGDNVGIREQFTYETQTSQYSDAGEIYVDMFEDYFTTNDIVISAGFQVANAIGGNELANVPGGYPAGFEGLFERDNGLANSKTKAFVLLDDASLSQLYTNTASVSFAAEGAGYMAGIAAAGYTLFDATTNHAGEEGYNPNIVMWGGQAFPTVYDFMSGFEQAINEYNLAQETDELDITLWSGGLASGNTFVGDDSYTTENGTGNSNHWYSGGFDADVSTDSGQLASIKTINAVQNGASVVFPVAGGNTAVAENAIADSGSTTTKMMGVDADATLSATHPELFLGTAEKNLTVGGQYGIWAMDDFDGDGQRNYQELYRLGAAGYETAYSEDTYFSTNKTDILAWHDAGVEQIGASNEKGIQLRGDAENGGVGLMVGGTNEEGSPYNTLLLDAFNSFATTSFANAEDLETAIAEQAATAAAGEGIEFESETFTDDGK